VSLRLRWKGVSISCSRGAIGTSERLLRKHKEQKK
jgi:hypothetical protein